MFKGWTKGQLLTRRLVIFCLIAITTLGSINGLAFIPGVGIDEVYATEEHDYVKTDEVAATCTEAGKKTYKCKHCDDTMTMTVEALGHLIHTKTVKATCFQAGSVTEKCLRDGCDYHKETVLPKLAHKYEKIERKEPTCTRSGHVEYWKCTECGGRFSDKKGTKLTDEEYLIDYTGHDWNKGKVIKEATTTSKGTMKFRCKTCGETAKVSIPKLKEPNPTRQTESHIIHGKGKCGVAYSVSYHLIDQKGKAKNFIIVNSGSPTDAVSAGYLSNAKGGAPILYWASSQSSTLVEYARANMKSGGTVYLIGGTSAIPEDFQKALKKAGINCKRLGGKNKYITNILCLKESFKNGSDLMVVSASRKLDGIIASAVGKPVMLVGSSLTSAQKKWLSSVNIKNIYIVGNGNAVSKAVADKLKNYGTVERIKGKNSKELSTAIANKFFAQSKQAVFIKSYTSGYVAVPLANYYKAPIFLISDEEYSAARKFVVGNAISRALVVEETGTINKKAIKKITK